MKHCKKCNNDKPLSEFYEHKNISACRDCHRTAAKKWAKDNREKKYATNKRCREKNPEKHCARARKWQKENPEKRRATKRQWAKNNPEKLALYALNGKPVRRKQRRKKQLELYGMSEDQYLTMLQGQKGVCAICGFPEKPSKRLAVDHCHKSKKVRGLLCTKCNIAIGLLNDDLEILASASSYLRNAI